jgi:small redox-active disulfide protein 2
MCPDEVIQIRVGTHNVGIIGLKTTMEEIAGECGERSDREVQEKLLKRISRTNYIPDHVRESYGKALLREFARFTGRPFEDEAPTGALEIKVLGPGCAQCDGLERAVMEVMAEMDLAGDLEHVRDIKEIGKYGVMGTPALIIKGEVKSVGKVPPKERIKQWLGEAIE